MPHTAAARPIKRLSAFATLLAASLLSSVALAQSVPDATRFSPLLDRNNYLPLGVSGSGPNWSAWYLDLSTQRVIVCTSSTTNATPTCASAPMPK